MTDSSVRHRVTCGTPVLQKNAKVQSNTSTVREGGQDRDHPVKSVTTARGSPQVSAGLADLDPMATVQFAHDVKTGRPAPTIRTRAHWGFAAPRGNRDEVLADPRGWLIN